MKSELYLTIVLLPIFLFTNCKEQDKRAIALSKIEEVSKLALVEYDLSKIVFAEDKKWISNNVATFLAKTEATVSVGVDLDKMSRESVNITDNIIEISFPPIEIINFSYPAEKVQVIEKYSQNTFWNKVTAEEKDQALRLAETDIREHIKKIDMTSRVETNLRLFLKPLLQEIGFNEVYIKVLPIN
jgi:hypothetical protein